LLLEIEQLTKRFGGLVAVDGFSAGIEQGEIVGLIGPNGSGKTTLFNTITGIYAPDSGRVRFNGREVTGYRPHKIAKLGMGRTFQLSPLFTDFTVLENVSASFHLRPKSRLWEAYFNTRRYRRNEAQIEQEAWQILEWVGLDSHSHELARNLPHAFMKLLGVARALATHPQMLLLDEPLGGMNPEEIKFSMERFGILRDEGITILIVEHNMQILDLCDRVIVISFGQKIFEGSPHEVREDDEVISAYFGVPGASED
jgi:branched-chain amino acid transport system ATP-binding protein